MGFESGSELLRPTRQFLVEVISLDQLTLKCFRQRLHGTGPVWNRYKIGTDKPCVYKGPGGSGEDRICYLVPNGSTYEGDPIWNRTIPVRTGPV